MGEKREGDCVGEFVLGDRNDGGQTQVEFCERNGMMITNTWLRQVKAPQIHMEKMNYILMKRRCGNSVLNAHTLPETDADTDHNLLTAKVFLALKKLSKKGTINLKG